MEVNLPPDHECNHSLQEATVDEIDAIQHFRTSRARKSLRDAEELLVLNKVNLCLPDIQALNLQFVRRSISACSQIYHGTGPGQPSLFTRVDGVFVQS